MPAPPYNYVAAVRSGVIGLSALGPYSSMSYLAGVSLSFRRWALAWYRQSARRRIEASFFSRNVVRLEWRRWGQQSAISRLLSLR